MARSVSSPPPSAAPPTGSPGGGCSPGGSAVVGIGADQLGDGYVERGVDGPAHDDRPEVAAALVDVDEALLDELEHGQEAYDHLDGVDEAGDEASERHPTGPADLVGHLG